jgi:alkanesulfonate monooxygenase SsuD/methylene tetrahydromethanopterin reductase-like flavin-dependent oxidoreductase (luciferase family)
MRTRAPIPVGVNLTTMGVTAEWWLQSALRVEAAGFRTVWAWDHFTSFSADRRAETPVLECWTTLAAVAARSSTLRVGSFVSNVMNRHPAVLARQIATVAAIAGSGERVEAGIGIGGHPQEHAAYGIDFPAAGERAAHLEEAIEIVRGLLGGGPVDFEGAHYTLKGAYALPAPEPRPALIVGAETAAGARLSARHADAMTTFAAQWDVAYPAFLGELDRVGRRREEVRVLVGVELVSRPPHATAEPDLLSDLDAVAARWQERGADELIVHWVEPDHLDELLVAGERAGLDG